MRIAVIGLAGHVGDCLKGIAAWKGAEIVAVSDPDKEKTAEFIRSHEQAADADAYVDWRHLLEHAMPDVAIVAGESGGRAEQLVALAERNIHICSEKPLATSLADLARVRAAVAKSKSKLTMLLTMRYVGKYRTMRKLIAEGAVGEVGMVTSQKSYRFETRPDWQKSRARLGGTIPFIGVHALDLMRWVPGLEVAHVAAFHANVAKKEFGETEDTASVLLQYKNGATGTARLDYLLPSTFPVHGDDRLRIAGGDGVIETQQAWDYVQLTTAKKATYKVDPGPTENLFLDFLHSIADDQPCRMPAADAFSMTELVLKARDAADKKQVIAL